MKKFEFLPAIMQPDNRCLCCGTTEVHLSMDTVLYNGFGGWSVSKNGEIYYIGGSNDEWDTFKTLADIEKDASEMPNYDWRAELFTPLRGATYQRQNDKWVLVETNEGFA